MPKFTIQISTTEIFEAVIEAANEDAARADAMIIWPENGTDVFKSASYDWSVYDVEQADDDAPLSVENDDDDEDPTAAFKDIAEAEGWGMFDVGDGDVIQMDDEAAKFEDDEAAQAFVVRRAYERSEPHLAALRFFKESSPARFAGMLESIAPQDFKFTMAYFGREKCGWYVEETGFFNKVTNAYPRMRVKRMGTTWCFTDDASRLAGRPMDAGSLMDACSYSNRLDAARAAWIASRASLGDPVA